MLLVHRGIRGRERACGGSVSGDECHHSGHGLPGVRPGGGGGGGGDDSSLLCDGCDKCYHIYCLPRPLIEIPSDDWYCSACSDAHARSVDLPYRVGCELRYRTEPGIWATGIAESMGPKGVRLHCPSACNDVGDDWVPVDSGRLKPAVKKADEQEEFFAYEYDDSCMVCSHHKLKSWRLGSFIPTLTSMAITVSLSVCFLTPPHPPPLA